MANEDPPNSSGTFISSGTIKLEFAQVGKGVSKIYFSPAKDHTIEHLCEKYAVFISDPDSGTPNAMAVKLKNNSVEIAVDQETSAPCLEQLAFAAIKSVGIDLSVEFDKHGNSHIQSAVLPAQSHTK